MKLKITNVRHRPDVTVSWVSIDDGAGGLAGTDGDTIGKLLSSSNNLSEDGLTLTTVQVWASKQVYLDYIAIPEVAAVRTNRSRYGIENLISSNLTYEEIE